MIDRPHPRLTDQPMPWLGVNFWSRGGGPGMWRSFDRDLVLSELKVLADHGLTVTRSFFFWPHFMPAPGRLDDDLVEKFVAFLDLHDQVGMGTIPTFIVGHMSGQNWDPVWRGERDLYTDPWMLEQQTAYIRNLVERIGDHGAIAGWLVSNEVPIYGGTPSAEVARSWSRQMVAAIRDGGATHPVSIGDGAWGLETTGVDNGFRLRDLAEFVDFHGPHVYPMSNDVVRHHLSAAFACELSHIRRPVILEEFGVTTDFSTEEAAADYYRQVLHTSLLAGARGWLAWNNTDFDLPDEDPYRHHPFELHFGVTDVDGRPKAPLSELDRFRRVLDQVEVNRCRRIGTETALVVSSYLDTDYPFTAPSERVGLRRILEQAHVAAREADLAPAFVRELDGIADARLVLVPATRQLTAPTWRDLEHRAREGATVYCSYFAGYAGLQRGPWHPNFNAFFGIEHQLRYGLVDSVGPSVVAWTVTEDFGDLRTGDELAFPVAGNEHGRAYLPVRLTEARPLAVDQDGRPALIERPLGDGRIVLSAYPVEYFAAERAHANPEDTWRLYRALAVGARALPDVVVDRPDVLVDGLEHADGTRYVWLVSQSAEPVAVAPRVTGAATGLLPIGAGGSVERIQLDPFGVAVCRLTTDGG